MPYLQELNQLQTPFSFSQSSLRDYDDCPQRFQLKYIQQLKWPAVETAPIKENEKRQIEGQNFHRIIHQTFLEIPIDKIEKQVSKTEDGNLHRWWSNFEQAKTGILAGLDEKFLYPEHILSLPIGKHRLLAKYDLIKIGGNNTIIYDWKTYNKRPKDEYILNNLQTKVYLSLLIQAGKQLNHNQELKPDQIKMMYWYAEYPDEPCIINYSASQFNQDWQLINELIKKISAKQSFPLTENEKLCGFCQYRSYCKRGTTASENNSVEIDEILTFEVNLEQIQEIEF